MELLLLSIGKISTPWIQEGIKVFEHRIIKYIKFKIKELPDIKNGSSQIKEKIKNEEGKLILNEISPSDIVVLMDEKGKEYNSRDFAVWLEKIISSGKKRLVLIIGGPYGFSNTVYDRADIKVALSQMTFTHEMAKLFLAEQIYRAFTILKGEPYHHD